MIHEEKQTDKEKQKMYNKFTKKELINTLILANNIIETLTQGNYRIYDIDMPSYIESEKVPYHTICSCNPANGGSGVCGCIMANKLVDRVGKSNFDTYSTQ